MRDTTAIQMLTYNSPDGDLIADADIFAAKTGCPLLDRSKIAVELNFYPEDFFTLVDPKEKCPEGLQVEHELRFYHQKDDSLLVFADLQFDLYQSKRKATGIGVKLNGLLFLGVVPPEKWSVSV